MHVHSVRFNIWHIHEVVDFDDPRYSYRNHQCRARLHEAGVFRDDQWIHLINLPVSYLRYARCPHLHLQVFQNGSLWTSHANNNLAQAENCKLYFFHSINKHLILNVEDTRRILLIPSSCQRRDAKRSEYLQLLQSAEKRLNIKNWAGALTIIKLPHYIALLSSFYLISEISLKRDGEKDGPNFKKGLV